MGRVPGKAEMGTPNLLLPLVRILLLTDQGPEGPRSKREALVGSPATTQSGLYLRGSGAWACVLRTYQGHSWGRGVLLVGESVTGQATLRGGRE